MMTTTNMSPSVTDDSELVAASLAGNRDAFGQIVARYQSLICALAYSATGNLGASEDLAQETFITAWKHLQQLRERHKLRAWLCGIARNRINNTLRREGREPLRTAEPLDTAPESATAEPLPREQAISNEEQAILWRSLARIPKIYREPLVLFYREQQSIERVAAELELSEDAVKQRLSRGRKLLAEEVSAFVEGALERTNPGKAFTIAVLAALPILTTSAKAATLGAAAVKGGAAVKGAAALGLFNAILGPLIGVVGPWLQYRAFLAAATTDAERGLIRRRYRKMSGLMLGFGVAFVGFVFFGGRLLATHPLLFAVVLMILVGAFVVAATRLALWASQRSGGQFPETQTSGTFPGMKNEWEYRSRFELFGLPFVHIRPGRSKQWRAPVKAWIAGGDFAFGVLAAFGGVAVAPLSVGGIAIGLASFGGAALGIFPMGGFAAGVWVFGGFAIGWQAFGGCALAWNSAMGGLAVARDFAVGAVAQAAQANTESASQFINGNFFFATMIRLSHHIGWLNLLWLMPLIYWWRVVAKSRSQGRVAGR
jgi:RNA polymerase sigma factor (sigma-70 family)